MLRPIHWRRACGYRDWRRRGLSFAVALLLGVGVSTAQAEGPPLRADMIASLQSLQSELEAGNQSAVAERATAAARRLAGGNASDRWARALFLQLAATARARQGDDAAAADLFAEARTIQSAPAARRLSWLNQEARLRLRAGQTRQGADLLTAWVEQSGGDDDSRWLLVQARASLEEWQAAAQSLDRLREANGDGWADQHRALVTTVYQQSGRFDEALALLGSDADSADVWRRAAGLAQQSGDAGRAAAIWESGWRRGVLTSPDDLRQLARLHLAGGTPARAAEHLESWIDAGQLPDDDANRRLLAQAWTEARARDEALAAWKTVAERSGRAEDWQQLAEIAYGWGEWQATLDALGQYRAQNAPGQQAASQDARVQDDDASGRAWLLQGIAAAQLGRQQAAREAFQQAKEAGVVQAQQWLDSLGSA